MKVKFCFFDPPPTPPRHMTDPEERLAWLTEFQRQKEESERLSVSFESAASCPQLQNALPSPLPHQRFAPTFPPRAESDFFGLRSNGNNMADRYPFLVSGSAVPNDLFGPRSQPEETLSVLRLPDWREGNCGGATPHYYNIVPDWRSRRRLCAGKHVQFCRECSTPSRRRLCAN